MWNRRHHRSLWLLTALLIIAFALPAAAQDDETEARAIITSAYEQLADASYHYAITMDTANNITDADGETSGVQQVYEIEGEAVGADYTDTMTLTVTPLENEADTQSTRLARTRVDDAFYVELSGLLAQQLGVADGWWLLDDLLTEIGDDNVQSFAAQQFEGIPTPLATALEDDLIRSVTEAEPEDIDGVAVRVFEVEMKAIEMMTSEVDGTAAEQITAFLENLPLVMQSEISIVYRIAIGAEDGQLYRIESEAYTSLPFIEFGGSNDPEFDIENSSTVTIDIDYANAPTDIVIPVNINISE